MSAAVSAYAVVKNGLGLTPGSNGGPGGGNTFSWMFLLLSALETADTGPADWEVPGDAYATVLARLKSFSACPAYRELAQVVNSKVGR
ncbi:MAG TPA: hypothetical protein VGM05_33025 [Planctomycetaceae bacterium]